MNNLIRRNSTNGVSRLRDDFFFPVQQHFDKFFEDFFKGANLDSITATSGYPKMDVVVEGDEWVVKAALPGVQPENVKVEVIPDHTRKTLRISGKMSEQYQSPDDATYYVRELKMSAFQRQLSLPEWVEDDPQATIKDGILRLSWKMPKTPDASPATKVIEVKREE